MDLHSSNERMFNNADSFAMAFDEAWQKVDKKSLDKMNTNQKIDSTFEIIKDHPFLQEKPDVARSIATFRIKLLELE